MTIEILHRSTKQALFASATAATFAEAVQEAVKSQVDLAGANLKMADLSAINLRGAKMAEADLSWSNLRGTDLSRSDLTDACLVATNFQEGNLSYTILRRANMHFAALRTTNMLGTDLRGAKDIYSFGPIGDAELIGYAIAHTSCVMIQIGRYWGPDLEAIADAGDKYGVDSNFVAQIELARKMLMPPSGQHFQRKVNHN